MSDIGVSIIIPNYNHALYLAQRIESVLSQTYQDFELIILDDCSTDNSRSIINKYAAQDKRIQTVFNITNSGSPFAQWNKGVSLAQGEYIWIAESDDYAHQALLETLVPLLDQCPKVGLAYCQSYKVNQDNDIIGDGLPKDNINIDEQRWLTSYENNGANEVAHYLVFKNIIPNASALLFRKSVYPSPESVPLGLRLCGDWLTYIKMLEISDIYYHPDKLNYFRVHNKTVRTRNAWHSIAVLWERSKVLQYVLEKFDVPEKNIVEAIRPLYHDYLLNLAKFSFRIGDIRKYWEVARFLRPFTKNRRLKKEVYQALGRRLKKKSVSYFNFGDRANS